MIKCSYRGEEGLYVGELKFKLELCVVLIVII